MTIEALIQLGGLILVNGGALVAMWMKLQSTVSILQVKVELLQQQVSSDNHCDKQAQGEIFKKLDRIQSVLDQRPGECAKYFAPASALDDLRRRFEEKM